MQGIPPSHITFNPSRRLPENAVNVMLAWYRDHRDWAYPSEVERDEMREQTGLSKMQIDNWFINKRRRDKNAPTGLRRRADDDDSDEQPSPPRAPTPPKSSEPAQRSTRYALRPARSAAALSSPPPPPPTRRPAERPTRASSSAPRFTPAQSYRESSFEAPSPYATSYPAYPDPYTPTYADPPPSETYTPYNAAYGVPASTAYYQEGIPYVSYGSPQPGYVGYGSPYPSFPGQQPPAPRQGGPYGEWPPAEPGSSRYY